MSRILHLKEGLSAFYKPAMPHELVIEPAHSEAQCYVHSYSPKEVVARQPTRQAS